MDIVQIVLTLCTIKHVDIVQSSNGCDLELCSNNRYELCGHCILSNMWTLYIVKYVDIVYCQICGQLDIVQIVLTSCMIKHVDIVQSSNGCDLELCSNNRYELCGHCILSNMWTLYIVKYVDIVYCQICGQLDIVQIVLTSCMIKHVDIVQSSNGCDLEQVTLSTLGRTLTDSHSPAALNI